MSLLGLHHLRGATPAALWQKFRSGGPKAVLAAAAMALVGVSLTALLSLSKRAEIARDAQLRFDILAARIEREIEQRLRQPIYGLKGARGVYAASDSVTRDDFRNYVDSRHMGQEFPGIRGFGFIERVLRGDLERFTSEAKADGMPDFRVRSSPGATSEDLYVIKYLEPLADNINAVGYDMGQDLLRREAVERAVLTGQDTLSGRVNLLQDEAGRPGMLLLVPVYRRGADPQTPEQHVRALVGLVYAPLLVHELMDGVVDVSEQLLDFRLLADDGPQQLDLLYETQSEPREAVWQIERRLEFGGKHLQLQLASTPAFEQQIDQGPVQWIALSGLGLSLSLALASWLLISGRQRAEALAASRTADLAQALGENRSLLSTIHQHAIVSITDPAGTIIEANEAFCRISGYSREELLGSDHRIVNSGHHPAEFWRGVWYQLQAGHSWRGELCNRAKDGRLYWVDSIIAPIFDLQGKLEKYISIRTDISAAKRAAQRLQSNQVVLDRAERLAGLGAWELDLASQQLIWSDQTFRLHEVSLDTPVTLDLALSHLAEPGRAALQDALHQAASGRAWDLELSLRTHKGRELWVRSVGEASFDDHGALRVFGTYQDITLQRALEAQTRQANQVLRSVLENLPCALSVFDAQLNLLAHNAQFRRLLDFPDALFEGEVTSFERIIRFNAARGEYGQTPDLDATVQQIVERARHPSAHQFERTRPNGDTLEVRGSPMPDGGFVTTYVDISARKRAEAEILRAEALLRGSIDAVNEGFVLYDPDDRLVFCNEKYRQMYAASADLIVPGASFESIIRGGAERGQYAEALGRVEEWVSERMRAHREGEVTPLQKLGDGRWVRVIERRMDDGHQVGFRIDITDLMRATEAAESASRSKSQFLANMSHEIRTPMNAILGMLKLLQKTELSERQLDYASKTEGAARSLLGLLNDILDFSKVEAGKMSLDPQPFRLEPLLRDLSVILSATVGPKPVEVLFDLDPALPPAVVGDALRLQQVLINLCGNAVKFTPRGEVVLALRLLSLHAGEAELEFSVRDSGIGIAPEHQAHIFSGFTQAEASTTRRFGGTGLGLAISQRLVQLMGGELSLDSAVGQGSRFAFTLKLPLVPDAAETLTRGDPSASPLRALIVDDNPLSLTLLGQMAQTLGWQADLASSGEAGLVQLEAAKASGQGYQMVLIDWQMPGLDGFETARRIQALGGSATAPLLIMVTAHGRELLSQRSEQDQDLLQGFLVKPVTPAMLSDALHAAQARLGQPVPAAPAAAPSLRPLQGLRLLVVEDNPNNQQVAQELLEDAGALVQLAGHGQIAVDVLRADPDGFDVVLMDVQMPVMDGYTATRVIRQQLGLVELPIVAMTANAMASDREDCLAAGMNEHVGKPFDLEHLAQVLLRLSGRVAPEAPVQPERSFPTLAVPGALRQRAQSLGVDLQAAMDRFMGKTALFQRMVSSFCKSAGQMDAQLRSCLAQHDHAGAMLALHSFKGLAATLGAQRLSERGAEGETLLKQGQALGEAWLSDLQQQVLQGSQDLQQLAAELAALELTPREQAPSVEAESGDDSAFRAALQGFMRMLEDFDMDATEAFAVLQSQHGARLGAHAEGMDEAVSALDFARALQLARELLPEAST
ncbi:PAS-domain containing protein [Paucibacter sp. DJ1R-11]|uniref:CHASE domain-containing hybrid sensor histidine kinase/response regulator n=1 Tax=Paucibacter sp. DJ1R-11 TaxID=2893556 RepID=UPI0021E43315|nr:PAS-domain containing protein [Paucibacter sp. DJ1R-11]MCV2366191.1 PAS-domain containing protein [Paucibacter sp. DJ1R-11]